MAKVLTFAQVFPAYHSKVGQETNFVERILNSLRIEHDAMYYLYLLEEWNKKSLEEGKLTIADLQKFKDKLGPDASGDKLHTVRAKTVRKDGMVVERWKEGDIASFRVWSGVPYYSPQIIFAPDQEIKKVYDFKIIKNEFRVGNEFFYDRFKSLYHTHMEDLAMNDGLYYRDFYEWFKVPCQFDGQIICWKEVDYE